MRIDKKILSVMLSVALLFSAFPQTVKADDKREEAFDVSSKSNSFSENEEDNDAKHNRVGKVQEEREYLGEGIHNNFKYQYYSDGTATINGYIGRGEGDLDIPASIEGRPVTEIYGFENCTGFTGDLVIPDSVKIIGQSAFENCTGFTGDLVIPDSVENIDQSAFGNCTGFTGKLVIPDSVKKIDGYAFENCENFTGDLIIPDSVEEIGFWAFHRCSGFNGKLSLSKGLKRIGAGTFSLCSGLEGDLIIPDSVSSIDERAFSGCKGFSGELHLSDNLENIEDNAFLECMGLRGNLVIPDKVKRIGRSAFSDCYGLDGDLVIGDSVEIIDELAFYPVSHKKIVFPDENLREIGDSAFGFGCSSGKLVLPTSLRIIGKQAFIGCGFTGKLEIPDGVLTIKEGAFQGCEKFNGILSIPESVRSIARQSFSDCKNIKKIINRSSEIVSMPGGEYPTKKWINEETNEVIQEIANGVAIREDYSIADDELDNRITVSFNSYEGQEYFSYSICYGKRVNNPGEPHRNGYTFSGWYKDKNCTEKFDFLSRLYENTIIYAGWDTITVKSVVNGKGKANYVLTLNDSNEKPLSQKSFYYQVYDKNGNKWGIQEMTRTDSQGKAVISFEVPSNSSVNGTEKYYSYMVKVIPIDATFSEFNINFDVTVTPLSFTQTWSLRGETSFELGAGETAGVKIGPVKAEAAVAKATAAGGLGATLSAVHEYDNGKRNLELANEYDANVDINGSLGPTAEVKSWKPGVDISAFSVEGEAKIGASIKAGKRIEDYDPNDSEDLSDIGMFMMGTTAVANGNAFLVQLASAMGEDCYNFYGSDSYLHLNAGANVGMVELKNGTAKDSATIAEGTLAKAEYDSTYTYGAEYHGDDNDITRTMEKESAVTGKLFEGGIPELGLSGSVWNNDFFPQRYRLASSSEKFELEHQISKIDVSDKWSEYSQEEKENYAYDKDKLNELYDSVPEFKRFADGNLLYVFDSALGDMHKKLRNSSVEADYSRVEHDKKTFTTGDWGIGAALGLEGEANLSMSGIQEYEYALQSGTYKGGEYNVTAVNDIQDLVRKNEMHLENLVLEPLKSAAEKAKDYITRIAGEVGKAVKNILAEAKFEAEEGVKRIINLVVVRPLDSTNIDAINSFTITTYGQYSDCVSVQSVGDEMTGEAVSVGDPYYLYVTEEDGTTVVSDFSDTPVELKISYTDDMLANIGAGEEDEAKIEIFKYVEDKCGYVSVGGDVDKENRSVSATITEGGQYILAINRAITGNESGNSVPGSESDNPVNDSPSDNLIPVAPGYNTAPINVTEQTLAKTSSKTFVVGSDTYTVKWNSFVQYDGRNHNGVGVDASGNPGATKDSASKISDVKVIISKNGEVIDPSAYMIKAKNNKNATVSIDGVTAISSGRKTPSYTIKFKGKAYKELNQTIKKEKFEFGIIPVELTSEQVTFDKVKRGKDGSVQIKKMTFTPKTTTGTAAKPIKMKSMKKENKTDFVTASNADGSTTITGKNNFYGKVVYLK